jgi:hypothetical protein
MSQPASRFVILSTQRSGSNFLEDRLAGHPAISMYRGEVFRKTLHAPTAYRGYRDAKVSRRLLGAVAPAAVKAQYLRWLHRSAPKDAPVIGFRVMYDQLRRNPSIASILLVTRTPVIHLVRENVLETYVSVVAARQSGLYVTRSTKKKTPPVVIDAASLVNELERRVALIDRHRRLLRASPSIEVGFDLLVDGPEQADTTTLGFLGLEPVPLGSRIQRSGDRPLTDRIANIDEVTDALRGSAFAHLLD